MTQSLRIIVTGLIAQYPLGGMTWHYLQYVRGLARLGHEVYYLEDTGMQPYRLSSGSPPPSGCPNVAYLARVMSEAGLPDHWACRQFPGGRWFGMPEREWREVLRSADLLINVSGSLGDAGEYRQARRMAYVDTDPGFTQVRIARGHADLRRQVDLHDTHFSFGERLSELVPATGHGWRATRQPVVLSEWEPETPHRKVFTTVMNWSAKKKTEVYGGRAYGQKDVEFTPFLDMPRRLPGVAFEIALNAGKGQRAPRDLLVSRGWRLVDPEQVCLDYRSYRAYIQSSLAEWTVAKHGYVQGQSGWFSERSACYLAAGRPVVAQETGFSRVLPVGEGLLPFRTPDEAVAAVREVACDFPRHARAARALAEEYFNSDRVLTRLVEEALTSSILQGAGSRT